MPSNAIFSGTSMVKTFNRSKQMAAPEWAPSHPSVIAYEFSRAELKRLGQPDNHGAPCRRRLGFKALFEGAQSETVRMRLVPSRRARTAIARLSEVVDSLRKPAVLLARRDFFKAFQIGRNVVGCPMVEGAPGSSQIRSRLVVPAGTPDHSSGGETFRPSQVYFLGIFPPWANALLFKDRAMSPCRAALHCMI